MVGSYSKGLFKPFSSADLVVTCNAIETLCRVQVGTLGPYLQRLAVVMIGGRPVTFIHMGNQLSGIAPSQILSVEHYFSDLSDFEFDFR